MDTTVRLGAPAILELATSELKAAHTGISSMQKNQALQIIAGYLNSMINYDDAFAFFKANFKKTAILDRLKSIMECSETPIPSKSNNDPNAHKMRPWTPAEDVRLLAGIFRYGLDSWSTIARFVGSNRNRAQCSQRWSRGLNPRISKDTWSKEEDALLIQMVNQYGERAWTKIASSLGSRSDVQCRYRYRQIQRSTNPQKFRIAKFGPASLSGNYPKFSFSTINIPHPASQQTPILPMNTVRAFPSRNFPPKVQFAGPNELAGSSLTPSIDCFLESFH